MKIGIDARFWKETGVGRYIRNLVNELQHIDTTNEYVLFVTKKDRAAIASIVTNKKWKIVIADVHWHSLREQLELPRIIARESLDLTHFPYFSLPIAYRGKYVVTIHDLILHHFSTGEASTHHPFFYQAKLLGYKFIMQQAARRAQAIIAVSHATKDEVVDHLHVSADNVTVTYEGIDQTLLGTKKENGYGQYLLHVGNVYPHKNCKRLIDGFLSAHLPEGYKLLFVGREDYFMKQLKTYAAYNPRIIFLHTITDEELSTLYQHATATVVPSLMEGFGLPVLEAMANNCLVLASDIPALREIAREAALYCDPTDSVAIAQALEEISQLTHSEKKARVTRGKEISEKFTWEEMAEKTLAVYERCNSL